MSTEGSEAQPQRQSSDYFGRRASASTRPRLAALQSPASPSGNGPTSPHTPRASIFNRSISSAFNSPGNTFRTDDDIFVFEFGSRFMRAGLGGESHPRSLKDFGPSQQKRAGDYSQWLPDVELHSPTAVSDYQDWGNDHELWSLDIRNLNLGLVSDKIERAVRTALQDDLLIVDDTKRRLYSVTVPPMMPHPLLSTLMTTLFNHFPSPGSITLLSKPTMCAVSAGLRSALVVDIGWEETIVTAVYEYREVQYRRTSRAMKWLSWSTRTMLLEALQESNSSISSPAISLEDVEEVVARMIWCRQEKLSGKESQTESSPIHVPLPSSRSASTLSIPFSEFATPVETALFASGQDKNHDNDEYPISLLAYLALLSLPLDVRQVCLPRIVVTGGGSKIPGLKQRILSDIATMIDTRGWDLVHDYGKIKKPERRTNVQSMTRDQTEAVNKDIDPESTTPAHLQPPLPDAIVSKIQERSRPHPSTQSESVPQLKTPAVEATTPKARMVSSMGAWAGASLVAGLRVRGLVEVEREKYLQNGLAGADDTKQQGVPPSLPQRRSIVAATGASFNRAADRASGSWTLGAWA